MKAASIHLAALTLALVAGPLGADQDPIDPQVITVEGETFVASHNLGGYSIQVGYCDSASGDHVADGLDLTGEWIELAVALPASDCYTARLAVQGWPQQVNTLRLSFIPAAGGAPRASADFGFTGIGVGCDIPYLWAAGSLPLCVEAGDYRVRIEFLSGSLARIDQLELVYESSPTSAASWGELKSHYE
jgi:hypothetical protein